MSGSSLGAVIAGGRSRRYGSPKALVEVGGRRLIDRVLDALRAVTDRQLIITNDAAAFADLDVPVRGDVLADAGALGGIHAALCYAHEQECTGALVVACDMPFPSVPLLREMCERASAQVDAVVPESRGPRGIEPLFAWYATSCIAPIAHAVSSGDLRIIGFLEQVRTARIPLDEVIAIGDPERLFLNINTPADRDRAEQWAGEPS